MVLYFLTFGEKEGMASKGNLSLAIDLGGTNTRVAVVDRSGAVLQRERERTLAHLGAEHAMARLTETASRLMRNTAEGDVVGVGVSLGSPVDPDTGTMYNPPSLPGWDGFSPKQALEESLCLPVHIANDATLGAVGEYAYGIGQGVENLVYVTVSTGIGGGVIVEGIPVLGPHEHRQGRRAVQLRQRWLPGGHGLRHRAGQHCCGASAAGGAKLNAAHCRQ